MPTTKPDRPNIIVIICDDLGYGDLGCYGSKLATPNIDRLAAQGVRFTHHCTPIALCSASRAALMTGLYPTRVGATGAFGPLSDTGMSLDAVTTANVLRQRRIHQPRNRQMAPWRPAAIRARRQRGFDEFFGVPYSVDMDPLPLLHNSTIVEKEANRDTLTQQYTKKAVEFLSQPKEKPFFLYIAHSYPHIPLHASASFKGNSDLDCMATWLRKLIGMSAKFCERSKPTAREKRPWCFSPAIMVPGSRAAPVICAAEKAACMKAASEFP